MEDIAIKVDGITKDFKLPHERAESVKSLFVNPFHGKSRHTLETQKALNDISFEVKRGEFFGVVGRNGSGKSTLLKIIAGIYQPTKGAVSIHGRLVPFIELGVGFDAELTGRENVYLNGALLGFSSREIDNKYKKIVDFAEIERFMDQKLKNYSSGMQVRLAFSVATVLAESDILLIDEVLAVGDTAFQRKCFNYFRTLKRDNKTVILVTHDMDAIRNYCDRGLLLEDSRVVARGTASQVAKEYDHLFVQKLKNKESANRRWGSGHAHFSKPVCSPKYLDATDKYLNLSTVLSIDEQLDEVVVGFSVKSQNESLVLGSNNRILRQKLVNTKKGEHFLIEWKVPNIFNDGDYFVNLTVETNAADPCDWWEEATGFRVTKGTGTGFLVAPDVELNIKRQLSNE